MEAPASTMLWIVQLCEQDTAAAVPRMQERCRQPRAASWLGWLRPPLQAALVQRAGYGHRCRQPRAVGWLRPPLPAASCAAARSRSGLPTAAAAGSLVQRAGYGRRCRQPRAVGWLRPLLHRLYVYTYLHNSTLSLISQVP